MGHISIIKTAQWRDVLNSTKNCIDQEELQLIKTYNDPTTTSSIDPPSILQSEVEASIKRLKWNKAPEEDNITGGILQDFEMLWSKFSLTYSPHGCIIDRSPKHGKCFECFDTWERKYITKNIKTTDQSDLFPLFRRCFQTFLCKGQFVRRTPTMWASRI